MNTLFFGILLFTLCSLKVFSIDNTLQDTLASSLHQTRHSTGMMPTHPLGLFNMRIQQNFNFKKTEYPILNIEYSCGNIWVPKVNVYFPKDKAMQQYLQNFPWHYREGMFDPTKNATDSITFVGDGMLRKLHFDYTIPISTHQELTIATQFYLLDAGKMPYSFLNTDQSIEWFHSNIAGGEDPFARKYYGFNKAGIVYTDINGKTLSIQDGDFFIPGIEFHYYTYPQWNILNTLKIRANYGIHLGINYSKFNKSTDFGISASVLKNLQFKKNRSLDIASGCSIEKRQVIEFKPGIDFGNNMLPIYAEGLLRYNWMNKKKSLNHSFAFNFLYHNSYNLGFPTSENNKYLVYTGLRISSHWHLAGSHLFRNIQTWNFIYTISKKHSLSIYFQEDLLVNNAPDLQTGLVFQIPIGNSKK